MIKSTWKEEPEKRPLFSDIVQFFHAQNIEDSFVDEGNSLAVHAENDSGYLDIRFQEQTVINNC